MVDELTTGPASHSSASLDCQPNDYNPGKMLPRNRQFFKHQEELGNYACKPKHDYLGLLGMGRGVVGVLRASPHCTHIHVVRAIEARQEITFKSWHTEPQIP